MQRVVAIQLTSFPSLTVTSVESDTSIGMFLYVEVVLNTIEYLEVQDIMDELTIPPEDLDAA